MESHFSIFVSLEKVSSSLIGLISKQESETKAWNKSGQSKECFVLSLVYLPGKEALIPPSYLPLELFNNHHDFALIRSFKRKTLQEEDQDKKIGRKSTPQPKNCARRWRCRTSLIGMRTLSARLTLRPKIAFNNNKMHLKYSKLLLSDLPKNKVSQMGSQHTLWPNISDVKTFQKTHVNSIVHYPTKCLHHQNK